MLENTNYMIFFVADLFSDKKKSDGKEWFKALLKYLWRVINKYIKYNRS
jgi:hypothetical protein